MTNNGKGDMAAELAMLRELVNSVTHEVRNVVTGARGVMGIVGERLPESSSDRQVITLVQERLGEISRRMEVLSRFATPQSPRLAPLHVDDVFGRVRAKWPAISIVADLNACLTGDIVLLEEAFIHLVVAATSGDTSHGEIRVEATMDDGTAIVEVRVDPQETRATPPDGARSRDAEVAFAIARRILRAHGGEVERHDCAGTTRLFARLPGDPQRV